MSDVGAAEGGWSAADLQVHTRASDGMDGAERVLEAAVVAGLDCIAITEHDDVTGAQRAREIALARELPLEVIVGSEVTSRQGHILALWIEEPIAVFRSAAATVEAIWRAGGAASIAHPAAIMPPSLGLDEIDRLTQDLRRRARTIRRWCWRSSWPTRRCWRVAASGGSGGATPSTGGCRKPAGVMPTSPRTSAQP